MKFIIILTTSSGWLNVLTTTICRIFIIKNKTYCKEYQFPVGSFVHIAKYGKYFLIAEQTERLQHHQEQNGPDMSLYDLKSNHYGNCKVIAYKQQKHQ